MLVTGAAGWVIFKDPPIHCCHLCLCYTLQNSCFIKMSLWMCYWRDLETHPGFAREKKNERVADLLLEACIPILYTLSKDKKPNNCDGCRLALPSQTEHLCLGYGFGPDPDLKEEDVDGQPLTTHQISQAAPFLANKMDAIFKEMSILYEKKQDTEYQDISLGDFLGFFASPYHYWPFARVCSDAGWHDRLKEMMDKKYKEERKKQKKERGYYTEEEEEDEGIRKKKEQMWENHGEEDMMD